MRTFEKAVLRADGVVCDINPIHRRTAMTGGTTTDGGIKEAFKIDQAKVRVTCPRIMYQVQ